VSHPREGLAAFLGAVATVSVCNTDLNQMKMPPKQLILAYLLQRNEMTTLSGPLILVASLHCRSLAGFGLGSQVALMLAPSVPMSFSSENVTGVFGNVSQPSHPSARERGQGDRRERERVRTAVRPGSGRGRRDGGQSTFADAKVKRCEGGRTCQEGGLDMRVPDIR